MKIYKRILYFYVNIVVKQVNYNTGLWVGTSVKYRM